MPKFALIAATCLALASTAARAVPTSLWAVDVSNTGSGTSSNAYAEQFGLDGALLRQVNLGSGFSPSGIALSGSIAYISSSTDGLIRRYDLTTGGFLGSVASGKNALGSLSIDGTGLWANDYTGGNRALHFTLAGVNDKSVTLSLCGSYCNAVESFSVAGTSYLLANRGESESSATYDVYRSDGTLVSAARLSGVPNGAGAAYDPSTQRFYASDAIDGTVLIYNLSGTSIGAITLGGPVPDTGFGADFPGQRFVADLAVAVPEPATLALLASAAGLAIYRRRRGA